MRVITWLFSVLLLGLATTASAATLNYTTYYHNDHLGSPVAATDERGGLLWRAHFRPYGERQEDPKDAAFGTVGYTGHAQDKDSGLVYAGARYLDPLVGRFMAVDPVGVASRNPYSFNRYAYANNNPHKFIDPDGRMPFALLLFAPEIEAAAAYAGSAIVGGITGTYLSEEVIQPAIDGESEPRAGEKGGPGAGKNFGDKSKDKIRDRDSNKCVFCKKDTTSESGPDRSEIDHAEPKKNGGNNSENNGQNTCRTCNRQKGGKSTADYLSWLKNNQKN